MSDRWRSRAEEMIWQGSVEANHLSSLVEYVGSHAHAGWKIHWVWAACSPCQKFSPSPSMLHGVGRSVFDRKVFDQSVVNQTVSGLTGISS